MHELWSGATAKCFTTNFRRNINFRRTFSPFFWYSLFSYLDPFIQFVRSSLYISTDSTLSSLEAMNIWNCTTLSNQELLFVLNFSSSTAASAAFMETSTIFNRRSIFREWMKRWISKYVRIHFTIAQNYINKCIHVEKHCATHGKGWEAKKKFMHQDKGKKIKNQLQLKSNFWGCIKQLWTQTW